MNQLTDYLTTNPRKLFLIDGIGALLTASNWGFWLVYFQSYFGFPKHILYAFAMVAACYAIYSFACFFIKKENWSPYIRLIAIANLLFVIISFIVAFYFKSDLKPLAWGYIILEGILVAILFRIEMKVASNLAKNKK